MRSLTLDAVAPHQRVSALPDTQRDQAWEQALTEKVAKHKEQEPTPEQKRHAVPVECLLPPKEMTPPTHDDNKEAASAKTRLQETRVSQRNTDQTSTAEPAQAHEALEIPHSLTMLSEAAPAAAQKSLVEPATPKEQRSLEQDATEAIEVDPLQLALLGDAHAALAETPPMLRVIAGPTLLSSNKTDEAPTPTAANAPIAAPDGAALGSQTNQEEQDQPAQMLLSDTEPDDKATPQPATLLMPGQALAKQIAPEESVAPPRFIDLGEALYSRPAPTRCELVVGEGAERVVLTISARSEQVHIVARSASINMAASLHQAVPELQQALQRHGLVLSQFDTGAESAGSGHDPEREPEEEAAPPKPAHETPRVARGVRAIA